MKKLPACFLLISLLFSYSSTLGQNRVRDTIFLKRKVRDNQFITDTLYPPPGLLKPHMIVGTSMLHNSAKNILLLEEGIIPISLEILEDCKTVKPSSFKNYPQLLHTSQDSNLLTIDIAIVSNCCHDFLGEAELIGKDTLKLFYHSYGDHCACKCCFKLRYKFDLDLTIIPHLPAFVILEGSRGPLRLKTHKD
ncbi:MAG: hypothetical protein MRZ79_27535 [Bacteroidia bacterium]|nr:hypothetical protein [Bacteroidia bacterium]